VPTVLVTGQCLQPGPQGLVGCDAGTQVRVSRCEDRSRCLRDSSALTVLDFGVAAAGGGFALHPTQADVSVAKPLVYEGTIGGQTNYRTIDFGLAGTGSATFGASGAAAVSDVIIDPTSEGSVRSIDRAAYQNVADVEVPVLLSTARAQNPDYAGLSAQGAADKGTNTASAVFFPPSCPARASSVTLPDTAAIGPLSCTPVVALAFQKVAPDPLIGAANRVQLTLGAYSIDGGTTLTVDKVRLDLDCTDSFFLECIDDGAVVVYLGDSTIETTCSVGWTSNLPQGGPFPNTVEFTPIGPPLQIPAFAQEFCTLSVGVMVVDVSHDQTPFRFVQGVGMNGACDNGLFGTSRFVQDTIIPFHECPSGQATL
jgi:hypothetical protein